MPSQEAGKFILDVENAETDHLAGFEFDQHIHVAVGTEVISQDGTEQRQFPDVMAPAELSNSLAVDGDPWAHFSERHTDWNPLGSQHAGRAWGTVPLTTSGQRLHPSVHSYDVTSDGPYFVVIVAGTDGGAPLAVVKDWTRTLRRR